MYVYTVILIFYVWLSLIPTLSLFSNQVVETIKLAVSKHVQLSPKVILAWNIVRFVRYELKEPFVLVSTLRCTHMQEMFWNKFNRRFPLTYGNFNKFNKVVMYSYDTASTNEESDA